MPPTELAFVALGSNLGNRQVLLSTARKHLAELPDTTIVAESTVEETKPLGQVPQGKYLNQMVLLRTALSAQDIFQAGMAAEEAAGRTRTERWGPRTLDVDLVRFGDQQVDEPDLTVPHPELANRPFWLREMAELLYAINGDGLPPWAVVGEGRREHIRRVAALMETWAIAMGRAAEERARWIRAAFLHDALRNAPEEELERLAEGQWGIPSLYHGPAAAKMAEERGETDRGVLDAVRYHSVGYAGWDDVGKMLYLADYLEPGRSFKRKERDALAARVPRKPRSVLRRLVRKRIAKSLKSKCPILPEEADFWNSLVASS